MGFTLIELSIVLGFIAILSGIWVIPAYHSWLANTRLETKARELFGTLQFARILAMQRNTPITVCQSNDQTSCSGTWHTGWIILATDQKSTSDVIQVHSGLYPQQKLIMRSSRNQTRIQFQPQGTSIGHSGRLVLCSKDSKIAWVVLISHTGRVRLNAFCDASYCTQVTR